MQNPLFDTSGPDEEYAITCPQCGCVDHTCIYEGTHSYKDHDGWEIEFPIADLKCAACSHIWLDTSNDPRNWDIP